MKKALLLLVALFTATIAFAKVEIDGIYYNLYDEIKIAEVTYQYNWSDDNYSGITSITIPEKVNYNGVEYSVISIGYHAFYYCSSLTSVTIPNSVTTIGDGAFLGCISLTSITIPNSVISIGDKAFSGTPWLENQSDGCVYINNYLYTYKGEMSANTHIDVKEGTTRICDYAFWGCSSLTSITIPNSVTSIGKEAFRDCTSLISITIPNSVTSIGDNAFYGCSSLTSVTIGNSVTEIGYYTFYGCSSLTSITIPNSVTEIGSSAFEGCSSLTSITIPNSVTSIGDNAFYGCSSLTSITISNSITEIGLGAFFGTSWLENQSDGCVYINNCLYMYKGEMSANTHIDVKEGTTRICNYVFYGCSSLTSITIPNSVIEIGLLAFCDCSSLTSVTIGNSVTEIGYYTFCGCSSLTSITIPNSVTSIEEATFYGCSLLTSITIPNSVTSIGDNAFRDCTSLTSITIPNSVTSIGSSAFHGCQSLTSITIQVENPLTIDEYTFKNVSRSVSIKVPCGSIAKYKAADGWNEFTNYEEILPKLTVDVNDKTMGFATITKPNSCTDDVAQVQAQALTGYEFVRWSDGATENPHILLVTEDMTITAEFRKIGEEPEDKPGEDEKHNNFIVESADETQGTVKVMIVAEAIEGFEFDHWSDGSTENPRVVTLEADVELYAYFKASTDVENSRITSAVVYSNNGVLHVEGAETDYHVLDAAGRLVYSGSVAALALPRGVYVVVVEGEAQKVVL